MAKVRKLLKRTCDSREWDPSGPKTQYVWEEEVRGLGLRLYESGRKAFVVRYRLGGRQRIDTIGEYGAWTPSQARQEARQRIVEADKGKDPRKLRTPEEEEEPLSVRGLLDEWLDEYAEKHRRSVDEDRRRAEGHLIPALGSKSVEELTREDVRALHTQLSTRGKIEANRVVEVFRAAWNWGQDTGRIDGDLPNPAGFQLNREPTRTRYVGQKSDGELERLVKAIDAEDSEEVRIFFQLALLTGARKSELLRRKWSDVNLDAGILIVPERKSEGVHTIHLTGEAQRLLKELPSRGESEWLFPSPRLEGTHRRGFRKQWDRIREQAHLEDIVFHDLRRTAGSIMAQNGVPLAHISDALGHQDEDVTKIYARLSSENQRAAFGAVEKALGSAAGTDDS